MTEVRVSRTVHEDLRTLMVICLILQEMKTVSGKSCTGNQNTCLVSTTLLRKMYDTDTHTGHR